MLTKDIMFWYHLYIHIWLLKIAGSWILYHRLQVMPVALTVNGSPLERVDAYKYLGIWITSDLTWSKQVMEVCKKANR